MLNLSYIELYRFFTRKPERCIQKVIYIVNLIMRHCMRTALGTLDVHLRPSSICIKILRVAWKKERFSVNILMSLQAYEYSRRGCTAIEKYLFGESSLN